MRKRQSMPLRKIRYYGSVSILYVLTLLFAGYLLRPNYFSKPAVVVAYSPPPVVAKVVAAKPVISGKPVEVVIPSLKIDKLLEEGFYNPDNRTWTLKGDKAYFAMPSSLPNDSNGNTLVYGHYNPKVFYYLKKITPGGIAEIKTDNGHVFTYTFTSAEDLKPNDVSVFSYVGPPRLTIQTCTGSFFELRKLFHFSLTQVDGHAV